MDTRLKDVLTDNGGNYILPFFWQHGEEEDILREEMKRIHESGIGAVCVEARPHPDFAGPGWWQDLDIIMDEARDRKMRVWVLDDAHFPTGFANGQIRQQQDKAKRYLMLKTIDTEGPAEQRSFLIGDWLNRFDWMNPQEKLTGDDQLYAVIAARRDQQETFIDVTTCVKDGILYWDVPEGPWRIYILIHTRCHGGNPDYINMLDESSVRVLIDAVYEPHFTRYGKDFGRTFAGFFSDEPGFGNTKGYAFDESIGRKNMVMPWSPELSQLLTKSLGTDFAKYLPCLWQGTDELAWKVRYHYMDAVSRLYEKNFSCQLGQWCQTHGVEYIGHVIEDQNVHARLGCGSGHYFRALSGQHMSGIDIIGQQVLPRYETFEEMPLGTGPDNEFFHFALAKLGSSLGHIDPKKNGRTMCEIFGASGWASGIRLNKWMMDHALVRGVNYFVPHAFSAKEFPDPDCPPHFYARGRNPQFRYFKELMGYANRMCHLLNGGTHVAPVAVLYHAESEWSGDYMYTQKPAHWLTRSQIDFDILPSDLFSTGNDVPMKLEHGVLNVNGEAYQCLVVPYSQQITVGLAKFIHTALEQGFETIFIHELPKGICGETDQQACDELLKGIKACRTVELEQLPGFLRERNLHEISLADEQPYLRYYHYHREHAEFYMFFNEHPASEIKTTVTIPYSVQASGYDQASCEGGQVYCYDALNNKLVPVQQVHTRQGFEVPLSLMCQESTVIVIGQMEPGLVSKPWVAMGDEDKDEHMHVDANANAVELNGSWRVACATAMAYPHFTDEFVLDKLCNLSAPHKLPNFSGTYRYRTTFTLDKPIDQSLLDLGQVFEIAQVWVNGVTVGTRICPPYRFRIDGMMMQGENTLEIDVTNTLIREVKDPMSSSMTMEPSGLLGPVKILEYRNESRR